jgi:hypothetical protein
MIQHLRPDGTIHLRYVSNECIRDDTYDCEDAYDAALGALQGKIEQTMVSLGLLAWIDIDVERVEVIRNSDTLGEFLRDVVADNFDATFDGRWLALCTWGGTSEATFTLLAVTPRAPTSNDQVLDHWCDCETATDAPRGTQLR